MNPLLVPGILLTLATSVVAQKFVFQSSFEYPNRQRPALELDAAALNGALEQIGTWSGEIAPGLGGDAAPNTAFFREVGEDTFLIMDRPEAPITLVATLSETVPTAGTRVSYQFSTKRVGGHAKDYRVVGLDAEGNESFHIATSASNTDEGESLRLGYETEDGPTWDFETTEGEDSDGDFPFNNATGNINQVGTAILDLTEDGYVLTVSKGLDQPLYTTTVLPYHSPKATSIATIEIRMNGGATGVSTGMWLDDLTVSHSEGVSDPGLFVTRSVDFGNAPQNDAVLERVLPISNSGSENTLTITGVSSSGANPDNFAITDFPDTLAPGESGELTIDFDRKGAIGDFSANVILETNDPDTIDQAALIAVTATVPEGGDADGDGLSDTQEAARGTDPTKSDTDEDGLLDGPEVSEHQTDPLLVDSDGDGFGDGDEVAFGSDPTQADADLDNDGLDDAAEFANGSNPGLADTDGDTVNDGDEVNGDPATDPTLADTDGDSLTDDEERTRGTDGSNPDTDGDSLDDGFEILLGSNPTDIDSPVEGGGTALAFQSGFEYPEGFPTIGLDARNLNGAADQLGSFSGVLPEADVTGGLLDGETITLKDIAGDSFILVDRPLEPHVITAEFVSPVPVAGSIISFQYGTRRTGGHPKDVAFVGVDENGTEHFQLVVSASSSPPDGERLGFLGPDVDGAPADPIFDFDLVSGKDAFGDFPNVGANPGVNAISDVKVFLLAQGFVVNFSRPGLGYRTAVLPYRNEVTTLTKLEIRTNGGATGISSGFFLDDLVVETAGKPSDPNIITSPRVNLGKLAVTPGQEASVRILNTGDSLPLEISGVAISGINPDNFTVASFAPSILPGEAGTIDLLFDAKRRSGLFQAILEVSTNDPDVPVTTIEVTAGGVDLAAPVAHFPLDEAAGTTEVQGVSSNGLNGTIEAGNGSATLGGEGLASGSSLSLTGGGSVRVAGDEIAQLAELTVSMWVQVETTSDTPQTFFAKGDHSSPNIALITQGGDTAWFVEGDTSLGSTTGNVIVAGQAHHLVAIYGDDRAAIYVDGQEVASTETPIALSLDPANAWFFGGFSPLTFDGRIDDVQIYDRTLTNAEILTLRDKPGQPLSSTAPDSEPDTPRFDIPTIAQTPEGNVRIGWLAAQDVGYRVEFSSDLETWAPIDDTRFSVAVNDATLEDSNAERTNLKAGYYRVVLLP